MNGEKRGREGGWWGKVTVIVRVKVGGVGEEGLQKEPSLPHQTNNQARWAGSPFLGKND